MNTVIISHRPYSKITRIIWYIFYVIQVILVFRFVLDLLGANRSAPFAQFIYELSYPLVRPFLSLVSPSNIYPGIVDWNIIIAMLVYWIIAEIITELVFAITGPHSGTHTTTL